MHGAFYHIHETYFVIRYSYCQYATSNYAEIF